MEDIKMQAREIAKRYQQPLLLTILYIGLYATIRDLVSELFGILGFVVLILCIALNHGKVTAGLKVIDQEGFLPQKEAAIGIQNVKKLFSTYACHFLIQFLVIIVLFEIIIFAFNGYFTDILATIEADFQYGIYSSFEQLVGVISLMMGGCLVFTNLVMDTFCFGTFYLLETKDIRGFKAMKQAFLLGKGKFKQIFLFNFHYFMYMVCFECIDFLVNYYINSVLWTSFIGVACTMIAIFVYENEYVVAKALLFKELSKGVEENDFFNR